MVIGGLMTIVQSKRIGPLGAGNLENEMVVLADSPDPGNERDLSLALLRHHASSVKHHQYHNVDILTVRVDRV